MHTYTALFDTKQDAENAQAELAKLGIVPVDNMRLASKDTAGLDADRNADHRSFWQSLKDVVVSHEDRPVYEEGVRQGGWLLTVNVDDQNSQRIHDLLERSKAVNIDEREAEYRKAGTLATPAMGAMGATAATAATAATTKTSATAGMQTTGDQTIPIVQEELSVGKRRVEQGGVRVRSYVVTTPVQKDVNLREERVVVERHAVNQPVNAAVAADAFRERSVEMKTSKEEAVVSKTARVVEEVVVQKNVGERVERVDETVRRTEVDVQRVDTDGKSTSDRGPNR